ncbi:ROK family transcriptional regulator [Microbacteriaceae bacterium VKM Ac-2855]|nr:ROK family transcriptional regulator [Microbacteriaceae bacterium VKM Ac-2855]
MSSERPTALRRFRTAHENSIAQALRLRGPLTRQALQEETGLSRTTVHAIVGDLIEAETLVERPATGPRGRGRPSSELTLNPQAAEFVGVEVGRSHVGVVVANVAHEILVGTDHPVVVGTGIAALADTALEAVKAAVADRALAVGRVARIVIGTPLFFGAGLESVEGIQERMSRLFVEEFGVRPVFDNNARLFALAEMQFGAATDVDDLLYLHLDEGVGGGIVLDRRIHRGGHDRAGELGHVSVDPAGLACWCGGVGCLERYVAIPELAAHAQVSPADLLTSADAVKRVSDRLDLIAQVAAGMVSALDVRVIVVGGALAAAPGVVEMLRRRVTQIVPSHIQGEVDVRVAVLGRLGAARGGVVLALGESSP